MTQLTQLCQRLSGSWLAKKWELIPELKYIAESVELKLRVDRGHLAVGHNSILRPYDLAYNPTNQMF
jgi:hypothetical protein